MYHSYSQLAQNERIGIDFDIRTVSRGSEIVIMAPHGGRIEPGTSELAEAIAGSDYDFYCFEGKKSRENNRLHITSTLFDEPEARRLAAKARAILTIHGYHGDHPIVYVGGLAHGMVELISNRLAASGFHVSRRNSGCNGIDPGNLCNRCRGGKGVQLELTNGLRLRMFQDSSPEISVRPSGVFPLFVGAVRQALSESNVAANTHTI